MTSAKKDIQKILDMNAKILEMNEKILKRILNPPLFVMGENFPPPPDGVSHGESF